ncbi:MAG: AI-2E family transporter [Myxococcales bacterium]|nr:AI-2E family transporter [Myxococcales bacterium]
MSQEQVPEGDRTYQRRVLQTAIRLSLLGLLLFVCFRIVQPFLSTMVWGIIIAIATLTPYERLSKALGGRPKLAAVLMVFVGLLLLILPTVAIGASLVETAQDLSDDFEGKEIAVPPPPASVEDWPLVGEKLYASWNTASQNLESVLDRFAPELREFGAWLVSSMGHLGVGLFMFIIAIVIAGVLLPNAEGATALAQRVMTLVTGERGVELVTLCATSVRSVTRGILGVALIQSILAGLGMLAAGVPATGLWTLLVLLLAVMQLPTLLVLGPVAAYVFSVNSTTVAVLFLIWAIIIGMSDNVLKPMLMGRGSDVPMLVLFLGAIGGFMLEGIIGLFVGAVVLSVGYTLFTSWLKEAEEEEEDSQNQDAAAADPTVPTDAQ